MYRIGIDIGGTNLAYGLVSEDGTLIKKVSYPVDSDMDDISITKCMAETTVKFISDCNISQEEVISIGLGVPGVCNDAKGVIVYTVNMPFRKTNVAKIFSEYTSIPIHMANDANCAALGEALCGGAKGYKTSVTITLGTGVGGGIIIDGKIYVGANGAAGELGHMVIRAKGEKCSCGRRGCIEAYASATAIIRDTRKMAERHPESIINQLVNGDLSKVNGKTAFDAMRAGDKWGKKIVDNYIKYLGEGIINFINIFQPDIILIGGGISKEGDTLLIPLRRYVFKYAYGSKFLKRSKIACATLGNDAGIVGAAML
ncbi:MAG: ROK family protein [Clostridia bacterium]|nr:ROK family protein [Clostridia bacterium]